MIDIFLQRDYEINVLCPGIVQVSFHSNCIKLNNTHWKKLKKYADEHLESKLNSVQTITYCRNCLTEFQNCFIQMKHE